MKAVPFASLRMHFPDVINVGKAEIFHWIGYPENIQDANFDNTCAIRLSMALLGAGFPNPGTYPVKAGKFKGRMIETKQRKLSHWLARQLGQPEKYDGGSAAKAGIGARRGIVSFFKLHGSTDNQGHIDIVMPDRWGYFRCGHENEDSKVYTCYWDSVEVWFWPLR
jgi:hypothetical protein